MFRLPSVSRYEYSGTNYVHCASFQYVMNLKLLNKWCKKYSNLLINYIKFIKKLTKNQSANALYYSILFWYIWRYLYSNCIELVSSFFSRLIYSTDMNMYPRTTTCLSLFCNLDSTEQIWFKIYYYYNHSQNMILNFLIYVGSYITWESISAISIKMLLLNRWKGTTFIEENFYFSKCLKILKHNIQHKV